MKYYLTISLLPSTTTNLLNFWECPQRDLITSSHQGSPPPINDFRLSQISIDFIKNPTLQSAANQIVKSKKFGKLSNGKDHVFKLGSVVPQEGAVVGVSGRGHNNGKSSKNKIASDEEEDDDSSFHEDDQSTRQKKPKLGSFDLPLGMIQLFCSSPPQSLPISTPSKSTKLYDIQDEREETDMVAVLAIPSYMTPSDFLIFVGGSVEGIQELRMVR
jgi:hypothetical protein